MFARHAASSIVILGSAADEFEAFAAKFGKRYAAIDERSRREALFAATAASIVRHNARPERTYDLGLSQFADATPSELDALLRRRGGQVPDQCPWDLDDTLADDRSLPAAYDWEAQGFVTRVKDQGPCGTCWAFGSTASLESAAAIATGLAMDYSESQNIECNTEGGCNECAFDYLAKGHKACAWIEYQYSCPAESCRGDAECGILAVSGCSKLPGSNESLLAFAVASQPVAIGIAFGQELLSYKSGVYTGSCADGISHSVLIVGYGNDETSGLNYWRIKNSWSSSWGEGGYLRIRRGGGSDGGLCMLATDPSIPHVQTFGACSSFEQRNNTRAEGGACVGFNLPAATVEEAAAACSHTDGCISFSFNADWKAVFVCTGDPESVVSDQDGWMMGTCTGSKSCPGGFHSKPFMRAQGCNDTAIAAATEADARRACKEAGNCIAYTYSRISKSANLCTDGSFKLTQEYGWTVGECIDGQPVMQV